MPPDTVPEKGEVEKLVAELECGALAYMSDSGAVYAGPTELERKAANALTTLAARLAEAKRDLALEKKRADMLEGEYTNASPPAPVTEAMLASASAAVWNDFLYDFDKIVCGDEERLPDLNDADKIARIALTAALGTATAGTADCHDKAHGDPAHDWRTACLKCGVFRGSDLYVGPAPDADGSS